MPRFHLPTAHWAANAPVLSPEESHHALSVLRLEQGARVTVFDGQGREGTAQVLSADKYGVTVKILQQSAQPAPLCAVTLGQAVPKGKNMDLIIQKAVELGVRRIAPLFSDRTVVSLDASEAQKKQERWTEIAVEACKQCGQNWLPEILPAREPKAFLESDRPSGLLLIASLQPDARPLKRILSEYQELHGQPPNAATVLIGPEGDFTPAELALAKSHGFQPLTLGPIILRTETAALYSLSILAHELFMPA